MMVGRLLSYWEGNFSGAMLNFAGLLVLLLAGTVEKKRPFLSCKDLKNSMKRGNDNKDQGWMYFIAFPYWELFEAGEDSKNHSNSR